MGRKEDRPGLAGCGQAAGGPLPGGHKVPCSGGRWAGGASFPGFLWVCREGLQGGWPPPSERAIGSVPVQRHVSGNNALSSLLEGCDSRRGNTLFLFIYFFESEGGKKS